MGKGRGGSRQLLEWNLHRKRDANEFNISLLRQMSRKSCNKSKLGQGTFCFAAFYAILKRFPPLSHYKRFVSAKIIFLFSAFISRSSISRAADDFISANVCPLARAVTWAESPHYTLHTHTHTYIQAYTMYVCLSAVAVSGLAVILGRRLQRMFFGLRI